MLVLEGRSYLDIALLVFLNDFSFFWNLPRYLYNKSDATEDNWHNKSMGIKEYQKKSLSFKNLNVLLLDPLSSNRKLRLFFFLFFNRMERTLGYWTMVFIILNAYV